MLKFIITVKILKGNSEKKNKDEELNRSIRILGKLDSSWLP